MFSITHGICFGTDGPGGGVYLLSDEEVGESGRLVLEKPAVLGASVQAGVFNLVDPNNDGIRWTS